jgi:hypothetical protein
MFQKAFIVSTIGNIHGSCEYLAGIFNSTIARVE